MRVQALVVHGGGGADWSDIKADLRCGLERHGGVHQDFVISVTGDYAAWTSWTTGEPPSLLVRRLDCPDPRGCCLFAGHPGGHTPDLHDPLDAAAESKAQRLLGGHTAEIRPIR